MSNRLWYIIYMKCIENDCCEAGTIKQRCKKHYKLNWAKQDRKNNPQKKEEYLRKNREKKALYDKEYYMKNKKRKKIVQKSWNEKNKERIKEYLKTYNIENKDRLRILKREYAKIRPDINRAKNRRKRAKIRKNGFEKYTESQVIELYGTKCYLCLGEIDFMASRQAGVGSWEKALHIDHIVALSRGGSDTLDNVRPSHAQCNLKKHANPLSL